MRLEGRGPNRGLLILPAKRRFVQHKSGEAMPPRRACAPEDRLRRRFSPRRRGNRGIWRLGNLSTPKTVQKLRKALHAKAKAEAGYRFYALYDKISREDILAYAFAQCRSNKGARGVDGQDFADIETYGVERWLGELALALREESYQPDPIRRVFIPKANGKLRPDRAGSGLHDSSDAGAGADLRSRPSPRTVRVPSWEKCPKGGGQVERCVLSR